MIFQQDNALIHTAGIIQNWRADHGVEVMEWPANSPDLNPTEQCWVFLKDYINEHCSHLLGQGKSEQAAKDFRAAISEAWQALPQEQIDGALTSCYEAGVST